MVRGHGSASVGREAAGRAQRLGNAAAASATQWSPRPRFMLVIHLSLVLRSLRKLINRSSIINQTPTYRLNQTQPKS